MVTIEGRINEAPYPIGNGPQMDPRPPTDKRWFAWHPVRAGAPLDRSKKAGWVWLMTVEEVVTPVPEAGVGGVYRKLPLGKLDDFGLRQSPMLPGEEPCDCDRYGRQIATECIIHGCRDRLAQEAADIRPPVREVDQFGGPRPRKREEPTRFYMPEGGD